MGIIYTVPQNHVILVKRFGKHSRVQKDGLRFRLPFIESIKYVRNWNNVASKKGCFIELSEQQTDTPPRQCQTLDNVTIDANASVYWKILDPVKAVYDIDILPKSIADVALNALRANIGAIKLDQVLSERQNLNEKISAQLMEVASKWGVIFTRVEIQEINYSNETAEAMMQEMAAERKKRALIAEAEGRAQAQLTQAKSEAESNYIKAKSQVDVLNLMANAESNYLSRLKEEISAENASHVIMFQKYIDGMKTITSNPSNKVFLPTTFKGAFEIAAQNGN
ncbi:SPFH domain-containing protein [Tenacibaculum aiptasiae]|uniref:SPFH domain-containing protein n=1 Tax=Tenacibaculum aiptasiae TaxID=426481 RepID=UPI00232E00A1|nr:SPFH domain-containing protein [Tenacibaculum aiptasiae]